MLCLIAVTGCRITVEKSSKDKGDTNKDAGGVDQNDPQAGRAGGTSSAGAGGSAGAARNAGGAAGAAGSAGAGSMDVNDGRVSADGTINCDDRDKLTPTLTLSGDLDGDMTLSGVIRVSRSFDALGGNITVEAGTTFLMESGTGINFSFGGNPTIHFAGTPQRPIRFCGVKSQPGFWKGIHLGIGGTLAAAGIKPDSALEHVLISDGGQGGQAALSVTREAKLLDVQLRNSDGNGLSITKFGRDSAGLRVDGAKGSPLVLTDPVALDGLPTDGKFKDNGSNVAFLSFTDIYGGTLDFPKLSIPYQQQKTFSVGDAKLVFEAGVEYRLAAGVSINLGRLGAHSELQIQGTDAEPVVFRGSEDQKGFWGGIDIGAGAVVTSKIVHARIRQAGAGGRAPLNLDVAITLSDVSVEESASPVSFSVAPAADSKNLSISGSTSAPLNVGFDILGALPAGGTFHDNASPAIVVTGEYASPTGTIPNLGAPYAIGQSIDLEMGTDIAIAPGCEFIMSSGIRILIGWTSDVAKFKALGTESKPIVFRGADDSVGYWRGLIFSAKATPDSALDYVQIKNAGIELDRPISVTHSSFGKSAGYGIAKSAGDMTDYTATNTFSDNVSGAVGVP
jgi:hypothetical protein